MNSNSIRLRRDIRFVQKSQRQRFFFCLKFLSVLPPQEQNNLRRFNVAWKVQNGQRYYKNVIPRNIHDEFIASHQTSCEHGLIYFTYYHRHLMICLEIALNFAEQVLLAGKDRIPATLYTPNAKVFDAAFARYKVVIDNLRKQLGLAANAKLPQVTAHYWNPTDYTTNISIPQQLQSRNPDAIDQLYFAINGHYAWNFNFATRWFSNANSTTPQLPTNFQTMGYFSSQAASYSDSQNRIVYGNLNPRSTSNDEFFGVETVDQFGMTVISNTAADINLYKNYQKLKQTGSTIDVCTLDQSELNTLFGSKIKNLHWLSKAERSVLSAQNSINAYNYNNALPHFQFAYALFKQSNIFIKDYVSTQSINPQNSMERSHNTMHNIMQLFMSDSQLSITNPIFFLYHSWIDFELELKIRMIRTSASSKSEYNYAKSYLDTRIKPFSVMDQVSGTGQIRYGNYNIFEWANPLTRFYPQFNQPLTAKDYQVAFKSRNFIINDSQSGIRRSDQLTPFYQKEYLPTNGKRYAYFKGFNQFVYDYNYEVQNYDSKGKNQPVIMSGNVVAVPSYIQQIFNDYNADWNNNKTSTPSLNSGNPVLNSPQSQEKRANHFNKSLAKAIRLSLGVYSRYPSSIKSCVIPIVFKITKKGEEKLKLRQEHAQILKRGVVIAVPSLFTRGIGSQICPNCKDQKELFVFASEKIAEMSQNLYCDISQNITKKLYFKVQKQKVVEIEKININELFELSTPRSVFTRLQFIQGARQVDFIVNFKGKEIAQDCHISLSLHSYSVQQNKLNNVVIRKIEALNGIQFQFPRLLGINFGKDENHFDYRYVQGNIVNGNQACHFSFDINLWHRLITFVIDIQQKFDEKNQGYLDVEIYDRDYKFKMNHFNFNKIEDN